MNPAVVPTEAERSEAQWRDLVSIFDALAEGEKVPPLRFAPVGTTGGSASLGTTE